MPDTINPGEPTKPTPPVAPVEPTEPVVPATPPAEPQPPKQTAQERIDEITYKMREEEREKEYWKNLALGDQEPPEPTTPAPKPADDGRPKQANFATTEEYEDALLDWHDQKKESKSLEATKKQDMKDNLGKFNKNAAKLREAHEDFDQVIETPVFTETMRSALFMTDNGPMLAYHLGKNREEADRSKVLPPDQQLYEIGKLETKLLLAQQANVSTTVPEPLEPVGATGVPEIDPQKMSTDEWMEHEKKREIAKIKANLGPRAP